MADFDAGMGGGAVLRLGMSVGAQDIANNQSRIDWHLTMYKGSFSSWQTSPAIGWSANIGGVGYGGAYTFDFRSTSYVTMGAGSTWVAHAPDGTLSVSGSGYTAYTGTSTGGPTSTGGSMAVTRIPRGPQIEVDGAWGASQLFVEFDGAWATGLIYVEFDGAWVLAA